ncbi:MAG: hypothetical protein AB8I08_14370 [Sandaracinaceae bacterium]
MDSPTEDSPTADSPTADRGAVPVPVVQMHAPSVPEPSKRARSAAWVWVAGAVGLCVLLGGGGVTACLLSRPGERVTAPMTARLDAGPAASDAGALGGEEEPEVNAVVPELVVPQPEARSCPDHSGHWAGTWGASSSRGSWTADFTERPADGGGMELHGDIRVRGTACGTGGHIVGRILEDCSVEFDPYRTGPCRVRYRASFEGERLTGTLAATGFGMADQGSWRGTRRGPAP